MTASPAPIPRTGVLMTRSRSGAAAVLAAALALAGCSKTPPPIVPVEGVVLLNDQPLPNAEVQFVPVDPALGAEYTAVGTTDEQGRFRLTCKGQPGACVGDNRVTVADASMPESLRGKQNEEAKFAAGLKNRPIPARYNSVAATPLKIAVSAGQAEYKVEMKR